MAEFITDKICKRKVSERTKISDTDCSGFYVSITTSGKATFSLRYWNETRGIQDTVTIGAFDPDSMTSADARAEAFKLKGRAGLGEDISQTVRVARVQKGKLTGVTVNQLMDEYLAYIQVKVAKPDGEKRARVESWKNVEGFLELNVRPVIGNMVCSEVTKNDIAGIQNTVAKRSTASARQTRSAMKRMFAFAAEAGRDYIQTSPVVFLPSLDKEHPRPRVLTPTEIRTLWWGLDDPNLPCTRSIALALKFELATMLRSAEVKGAFRSNLLEVEGKPVIRIPLRFVKKRRVILQPLNGLATEIVNEAKRAHNHEVLFNSRSLDPDIESQLLNRSALNQALGGRATKHNSRVNILDYLGLKHFTVHDLRRTAATLAGEHGCTDAEIALCLDHSKGRGENVVEAPSVTGRVYVQSARLTEKRKVLDVLDRELRKIIGKRPARVGKLAA